MPERFHWILEGRLAAMGLPGRLRPLEDDLRGVYARGVRAVATLTERPLDPEALQTAQLEGRHFPINDFDVPYLDQVVEFCQWVDEQVYKGNPVAAHCFAGLGRTGTMVACYLVKLGASAQEAMAQIRKMEPGYVQTLGQEGLIEVWETQQKDTAL